VHSQFVGAVRPGCVHENPGSRELGHLMDPPTYFAARHFSPSAATSARTTTELQSYSSGLVVENCTGRRSRDNVIFLEGTNSGCHVTLIQVVNGITQFTEFFNDQTLQFYEPDSHSEQQLCRQDYFGFVVLKRIQPVPDLW